MRDEWGVVRGIAFLLLCLCGLPTEVSAQYFQGIPKSPIEQTTEGRVPEDFYVMPWIAAGAVYDDNVFFSRRGQQQDDVFLRITPGLQASYQSSRFTVIGNYRFDSEVYSKLDQLNSAQQRQFGTLELRGRPSTNWTWGNTFGYAQTQTPFELNILTSVQAARLKTERYYVNPSTEYRFDSLTRMTAQYAFSKDIFAEEVNIYSHIFNVGLDRRIGAHDTLGPAYVGRHFSFGGNLAFAGIIGGDPADVTSHAVQIAWGHEFSADTRLDVRVGPRVTNGRLDDRPEAFVGLRRKIQNGEVGLSYTSALVTIIGTVGGTQTDTLMLSLSYEPVKRLTFTVLPSASWIKSSAFDATIYTGYVEAAYQFNKYVTAKGSAFYSYQESVLPVAGRSAEHFIIPRSVYWLRLEFTYASRLD